MGSNQKGAWVSSAQHGSVRVMFTRPLQTLPPLGFIRQIKTWRDEGFSLFTGTHLQFSCFPPDQQRQKPLNLFNISWSTSEMRQIPVLRRHLRRPFSWKRTALSARPE